MEQTSVKKETGVDWLMTQLYKKGFIKEADGNEPINLMKQAKEIGNQQQDKFAIDFFNWCNSEDAEDLLHDLIMVGEVDKNVTIEQILEIYKNKYKITITKEEAKQECKGSFKDCFNSLDECVCDIMKQETPEEVKPPIGKFVIDNAVSTQGPDGAYYHYSEVCKLLRLQQEQMCNHNHILTSEQGHRVIKCSKCNDVQPV